MSYFNSFILFYLNLKMFALIKKNLIYYFLVIISHSNLLFLRKEITRFLIYCKMNHKVINKFVTEDEFHSLLVNINFVIMFI